MPEEMIEEYRAYRDRMVERIAETDDDLLVKYIDGEEITKNEIKSALRKATIEYRLVPVTCGSALRNTGVQPLIDAIGDYLPSPLDVPPVTGVNSNGGDEVTREPAEGAPFAALAFKAVADPFIGRLVYFRVYSGKAGVRVDGLQRDARQTRAAGQSRPAACPAPRGPGRGQGRGHRGGGRPETDVYGRHSERRVGAGGARDHHVPGPGHVGRHRAEDEGRPGPAGRRAVEAGRRGPHLADQPGRRGRPDRDVRDGRAPPGDRGRPHEARVQGRGQRRQAAGRVP